MPTRFPIDGTTAEAITASIERAIEGGRLAAGQLLPPIRDAATRLQVSPATVAAAYRAARVRGLTTGQGRRGTRVRRSSSAAGQPTVSAISDGTIDLASGNPDPDLLPPLAPALEWSTIAPHLYGDPLQFQPLLAFAASEFAADGISSDALAVVGGALDGVERTLQEQVRKGDHVAVEDPGLPAMFDLIAAMGFVPAPVAVDGEGPMPDSLRTALRQRVRAAILTPRAHNPTGAALSAGRVAELKDVLRSFPDALIVENDAAGPVSGAPARTVCDDSRAHWAVIRSTSKFLGPDLRVAVVAGDPLTIARVQRRQAVGARWVSHLLQRLALALWSDPASGRLFARAAAIYAQRRGALVNALAKQGIELGSRDGPLGLARRGGPFRLRQGRVAKRPDEPALASRSAFADGPGGPPKLEERRLVGPPEARSGFNVWIPVADEGSTVNFLARRGWAVAAGERFRLESGPAIRVTTATLLPDEARRFAADLVEIHRPATAVFA